jgi:hypothetical protein
LRRRKNAGPRAIRITVKSSGNMRRNFNAASRQTEIERRALYPNGGRGKNGLLEGVQILRVGRKYCLFLFVPI